MFTRAFAGFASLILVLVPAVAKCQPGPPPPPPPNCTMLFDLPYGPSNLVGPWHMLPQAGYTPDSLYEACRGRIIVVKVNGITPPKAPILDIFVHHPTGYFSGFWSSLWIRLIYPNDWNRWAFRVLQD